MPTTRSQKATSNSGGASRSGTAGAQATDNAEINSKGSSDEEYEESSLTMRENSRKRTISQTGSRRTPTPAKRSRPTAHTLAASPLIGEPPINTPEYASENDNIGLPTTGLSSAGLAPKSVNVESNLEHDGSQEESERDVSQEESEPNGLQEESEHGESEHEESEHDGSQEESKGLTSREAKMAAKLHEKEEALRCAQAALKNVQDLLTDDLTCSICKDLLWKPWTIPACGHTFCEGCLMGYFGQILDEFRKNGRPNFKPVEAHPYIRPTTIALMPQHLQVDFAMNTNTRFRPEYICPKCREPLEERPCETFNIKNIVENFARVFGIENPHEVSKKGKGKKKAVLAQSSIWDNIFGRV